MKERKMIKNPHAFQLLADDTRMKMVYLLRAKEMTVSQIAAELGLTPQTIYHHIKKLRAVDMVEVSREVRVEHLIEYYYRATAGMFHFINGSCAEDEGGPKRAKIILKALRNIGLKTNPTAAQVAAVAKSRDSLMRRRMRPEVFDKICELDEFDSSTERDLIEFAAMIRMSDEEFEKYLNDQRNLRDALLSRKARGGKT